MNPFRRLLAGLAPVVALVLALGIVAVAAHHHHDDGTPAHGYCAVCSAAPTAAVPVGEGPTPPRPVLQGSRLAPPPIDTPRSIAGTVARGRAPPAA